MHPDAFAAARGPAWDELAALTVARRLAAADVLRLGARYREAAADLAYARRRFGDDPVTRRLETLVLRARPLVYGARPRGGSLRAYLAQGYWRAVAERPKPLIAAWLLMLVPAILAGLWALSDPAAAGGLVPGDLRSVAEPQHHGLVLHGAGEHAGVSIGIFVNNIQVTFLAYAGGLTLGLLTGYVLATNGILLGAVAGLAAGAGNGGDLLRLVVGHGVLELSCIAVDGRSRPARRLVAGRARAGHARRGATRRGRPVDRDRARDDALARARRARRGLRDGHVLDRRGACRSGSPWARCYWALVFDARPRAFARAYALTHAPAKRSGRASTTVAPAAATAGRRARARAASRARPSWRRHRAGRPAAGPAGRRARRRARSPRTTAWRRASTGTASIRARAAASSTRSASTSTKRALAARRRCGTRARSRCRHRAGSRSKSARATAAAPRRRGRDVAQHAVGRRPARRCGRRARRRPRTTAISRVERRRRAACRPRSGAAISRPASSRQTHLAVLLDAVLVGHRAPEPRRRAPVDLAHVVVGRVVAHRLERRCRGRAARARGGPTRGSRPWRTASASRRAAGEVGIDQQLGVARPSRWYQAPSPSGPVDAHADRRAARAGRGGARRARASSSPSASLGSSVDVGGQRLAHAHAARPRRTRRPRAARARRGRATGGAPALERGRARGRAARRRRPQPRAPPRAGRDAPSRRGTARGRRDSASSGGRARRRAHRGTGTAASAAAHRVVAAR